MTNERCSESVREPGPWPRYHPCERRVVVFTGTEGWCKIHSPEAKAARAQKATERWQQQQAEIMAPHIRLAAVTARAGEMETLLRDLGPAYEGVMRAMGVHHEFPQLRAIVERATSILSSIDQGEGTMSREAEAMTMGFIVTGPIPRVETFRVDCPTGCGQAWSVRTGDTIPDEVRATFQAHLDSHKPVTPHDGGA